MTAIIVDTLPSGKILLMSDKRESDGTMYSDKVCKFRESETTPLVFALAGSTPAFFPLIELVEEAYEESKSFLTPRKILAKFIKEDFSHIKKHNFNCVIIHPSQFKTRIYTIGATNDAEGEEKGLTEFYNEYRPEELPIQTGAGGEAVLACKLGLDSALGDIVGKTKKADTEVIERYKRAFELAAKLNWTISTEVDTLIIG